MIGDTAGEPTYPSPETDIDFEYVKRCVHGARTARIATPEVVHIRQTRAHARRDSHHTTA